MSSLLNTILRLGLSLSLMDRELFVSKVAEFLEQYRDDPEQMERVAQGLYRYLEELKSRMDMKDMVSGVVESTNMPTREEIQELTKAIEKLSKEIHEQKQQNS